MSDEDFLQSAASEARRLRDTTGLSEGGAVLDIGCGAGRLAFGLVRELGGGLNYLGADVRPSVLTWSRRTITRRYPGYRFKLLGDYNARYNPRGKPQPALRELRSASRFNVIYAYSVFSHMEGTDLSRYFLAVASLLAPGGAVCLTAFVEDDVEDEVVNPPGYGPIAWSGPLHCVRYSTREFTGAAVAAGLRVTRQTWHTETDGQSFFVLAAAPDATGP